MYAAFSVLKSNDNSPLLFVVSRFAGCVDKHLSWLKEIKNYSILLVLSGFLHPFYVSSLP